MVQNWLESIAQNLVAEFLFLLILFALGWLLYLLTHRQPLLSFFEVASRFWWKSRTGVGSQQS